MGPRLLVEDDRGRLQVLKLISDITDDPAALAAQLDQVRQALPAHPALLLVTDIGTSDEGVYLASPVSTAPSLDGRLRGGRQTLEATLPWLRAVTAGLQAAHEAGVWHGAIHPRDVLLTDEGGMLTGVGIAPVLEHLALQAPIRVPFTAPERASGGQWDARADQYSLAMLALDALSGRRLIAGTIPAFDRWTLAETPAEDARLHEVFVRALDPDPDKRYASVDEWLTALAGADRPGESGALSRFARDGVILATPSGSADGAREIKVQPVDDQKGDSLSLFPEETTAESPTSDVPVDAEPVDDAREGEQEWLVAAVPEDVVAAESDALPEPDALAIRYDGPATSAATPSHEWRLDESDPADTTADPTLAWHQVEESSSRRPWLVVAVMLVLAAIGFGTWRSLQGPADAPAAQQTRAAETGPFAPPADQPDAASPAPPPAADAPAAGRQASSATSAPGVVPQAPVASRPPASPPRAVPAPAPAEPAPAAPVATGRVLIRSSPAGQVRVNGVVRGETPVVLRELPFGVYSIVIARPGFEPVEREVTLASSQPVASLSVDLLRLGAAGTAAAPTPSAPPPPRPSAEGVTATAAPPARPSPAPPASAAGVGAGAASQALGGIFVTSTPSRARLIVDGQVYGTTPASIPGLTAGAHTVRVEAPGYRPWEGRVAVLAGARVRVEATLQQEQE